MTSDKRRERLRFRSWHRGTREMDLLMGRFADACLATLDEAALRHYESILAYNDLDVYNWIIGAAAVPPEFDYPVTHQLIAFHNGGTKE